MTLNPEYITPHENRKGDYISMKGSVFEQKDRGRWAMSWYQDGGTHVVTKYPDTDLYLYTKKIAEKCQSIIQADEERCIREKVPFYIERYTGKRYTNVLDFYREWMAEAIEPKRKPATIKGYWSYFRCWIKPFFKENVVMLHEIQFDTLTKLLNFIKLDGKGKMNVMMALHSMMTYAHKSNRIRVMPPFPSREDYNIVEPTIRWLPEDRQMRVINAIPEIHRPIFLWLKYHLRRPSEACALRIKDYDLFQHIFVIKQSISARRTVDSTKTDVEHVIPCHSLFHRIAQDTVKQKLSGHFFTNPKARRGNKRYTNESLNIIWKKACAQVGESIDMYSGLKHSSCSQYINEKGLTIYDLQELTDHARLESVRKYAKVSVARKRELMETGKIIQLREAKNEV